MPSPRFMIFQLILSVVLLLIQYFFYRKIIRYIEEKNLSSKYKKVLNVLFVVFNVPLIPLIFFRVRLYDLPMWFVYGGVFPFYTWHFTFFLCFFYWLAGQIIYLPIRMSLWFGKRINVVNHQLESLRQQTTIITFDKRRRAFLQNGFTLLAGTTMVGTGYAAYAKDDCEVVTKEIFLHTLPSSFDGFTISMISDVHSSVFMTKERMKEYVALTNSLKSDLIVVTGDHVNSFVDEVYPFAEAFTDLKAPFGVYGVLGNHDFFTDDVDVVTREINDCGIKMLRNERIEITKGDEKFYLIGIDDTGSAQRADTRIAMTTNGIESETPKILLCHRPYFLEQARQHKIDLTLSGHTHGGQIVFAKFGTNVIAPARIASPYVAGLYSLGNSQMYVNRGIGTVGPPIRLNCPPEITKIVLRRKQSA